MPKRYKFRELQQLLKEHDLQILFGHGGRHQAQVYSLKTGISMPIPFHGRNKEVLPCYINQIEAVFKVKLRSE